MGLTFRGFIRYLSTAGLLSDLTEKPEHTLDLDMLGGKQNAKKEETFHLVSIIETYGRMVDYAIFREIRWLEEHNGPNCVYDLVDIARLVETLQPFPSGGTQLIEHFKRERTHLKEQKWRIIEELLDHQQELIKASFVLQKAEKSVSGYFLLAEIDKRLMALEARLDILLKKQNEWWKRGFAVHFAENYQPPMQGTGDMHNESLRKFFKQVAEEIIVLEVAPIERVTQVFSGDK